ncbi:CopG family transcriptional regulator [Euryarchaeota archaeon ex4484_178]|nr:MAG: CopG family transcriptional regulator [Euryarchaeota archaeon ex4484_178]
MGSEEDKMVRVPKEMYEAINDVIKRYPYYGWKGPSEFVRDAIRRYLKEINEREIVLRKAVKKMPNKIEEMLRDFMGEEEAQILSERIFRIREDEPEEYVNKVVDILKGRIGQNLAELLARKLLEVEK